MITYQVITVTSLNYKLIRHRAITWLSKTGKQEVIHINEEGVHRETYDEFMKGRTLLHSEDHSCEGQQKIIDYYNEHRKDRFRLLTNNCETFVNRFLRSRGEKIWIMSPQRDIIISAVMVAFGLLLLLLNKKQVITDAKCKSAYQKVVNTLS